MELAKILVAVDFSRFSDAAVSQGLKIARATGAEIVLCHIGLMPSQVEFDDHVEATAATEYQRLMKAQLDVNREKLQKLRQRIEGQGAQVSQFHRDGHPDEAICEVADEIEADMIVVGTHGRTGFRRVALGSVAQRVVRHASMHVLVARPDPEPEQRFQNIFVATDLSDFGQAAAELAFQLAQPGARIELFSAWQLPMDALGYHPPIEASGQLFAPAQGSIERATRERLEKIADAHRDQKAHVRIHTSEGNPGRAILRRIEEGEYDLVVAGSHGRRGFRRWFLGSVSERIVQLAPCSVLIARLPPTE